MPQALPPLVKRNSNGNVMQLSNGTKTVTVTMQSVKPSGWKIQAGIRMRRANKIRGSDLPPPLVLRENKNRNQGGGIGNSNTLAGAY